MKTLKKIMKQKIKRLSALILAGTALIPLAATADAADMFEANFVENNEANESFIRNFVFLGDDRTPMDIPAVNQAAVSKGIEYWQNILQKGAKNSSPAQIYIAGAKSYQQASATSIGINDGKLTPDFYWPQFIQGSRNLNPMDYTKLEFDGVGPGADVTSDGKTATDFGAAIIQIGQYLGGNKEGTVDGWHTENNAVLPDNEQASDLPAVMRHEMAHALGFTARTDSVTDENDQALKDEDGVQIEKFMDEITGDNNYANHLVDQNLNPMKKGMEIITSKEFERRYAKDSSIKESDYFILDHIHSGKRPKDAALRAGKAYFIGDNVSEVLGDKTYDEVKGLPVHAWDSRSLDLGHLEMNSLMSHAEYRNITVLNEAELAVMQDIGYDLDRKAYFGRSVYEDDATIVNTNGYFKRNEEGTAYTNEYSQTPLGIGLHVFGSRNNITQGADIKTEGDGAAGIRVDGTENTLTISKDNVIHSNGKDGVGLLVSYGRNHTVNQQGEIKATGENGIAARFDFGSNMLGGDAVYRGSYIEYTRYVSSSNGAITYATNIDYTAPGNAEEYEPDLDRYAPELGGALVKSYDIRGTLAGSKNSVYIGKNAFVQDIDIEDGAVVSGDITSDWKHFDTDGSYDEDADKFIHGLKIQYNGKTEDNGYNYDEYIPDLVTNLNVNTNLVYNDKITGADNIKVNVNKGTFVNNGEANVVNVTVNKDAAVYGGSYTVNNMEDKIAEDFEDDTTGKFINHGEIGAIDKNSTLIIKGAGDNDGKLVSDGTLAAQIGGEKGYIEVEGEANIEGSSVKTANMLPDENATVLKSTKGITGEVSNKEQSYAMMNVEVKKADANTLTVEATEANNLGDMTSEESESYNAVTTRRQTLQTNGNSEGLDEMRPLYSLDASSAKSALSDIGNGAAADMVAMTQRSSVSDEIANNRLNLAFDEPAANNDIWIKYTKHWGDMRSGSNYHASGISGGYDKPIGKNMRMGCYLSYNAMNLGGKNSGGNVYDTRLGVYGLYKRNAEEGYIYANCGWLRNKNNRSIAALGLSGNAKSGGHIFELGGEYKKDLQGGKKAWKVSPYVNLQISTLHQGAFSEEGLGVYNRRVEGFKNTYFAGQAGVEFKRVAKRGSYGARLGVKQAFFGADPDIDYRFEGDSTNSHIIRSQQDKTHFILRLFGNVNFANNWQLTGDARLQKGGHDKDIATSLTLCKRW